MALLDTLNLHTGKGPATANRVKLLLERLEGTEDHGVLLTALRDSGIRHAALTQALRSEYGQDTVTTTSVRDWRQANTAQVDGL